MTRLVAHRGWWIEPSEKNTVTAFERAVDAGVGIETDLRDDRGIVVISHDPPMGGEQDLAAFVSSIAPELPIALNIKADGLATAVDQAIAEGGLSVARAFDMSIPDLREYRRRSVPYLGRLSEIESREPSLDEAAGVWLDQFDSLWFTPSIVQRLRDEDLEVWIVSSELHGRDPKELWRWIRRFADDPGVFLCTDFPAEAGKAAGVDL